MLSSPSLFSSVALSISHAHKHPENNRMYACVCLCECMHACARACVHICVCVCVCVCVHACMHACRHASVHMNVCVSLDLLDVVLSQPAQL